MWFHSEKSQNTLSRQAAAAWVTVLKACSFPASSHGVKGKRTLYTKGHGLGDSPSALTDQIIHKTLFCSVILTSHNPSSVIIYLGIKQRMRDSSCKVIWQHCSAFLIGRHQRLALAGRLLLPSSLDSPHCPESTVCAAECAGAGHVLGFQNFSGSGSKKGVWTDKWRPRFLSYSYSCLPQWYL